MNGLTATALFAMIGFGGLILLFWDHVRAALETRFRPTGRHHVTRGDLSTVERVGVPVYHTGGMHRQPTIWAI